MSAYQSAHAERVRRMTAQSKKNLNEQKHWVEHVFELIGSIISFIQLLIALIVGLPIGLMLLPYVAQFVTIPGLLLIISVGWIATIRFTNHPWTRLRALACACAAGVIGFGSGAQIAGLSDRPVEFVLGLFAVLGLIPTVAVVWLFGQFDHDARAAWQGTYYVDLAKLSPEVIDIVRKHTNDTMRRRRVKPHLVDDGGHLTADDLREILEEEATEQENLARTREAESQAIRAETEHRRVADYYNALSTMSPEKRVLVEATFQADKFRVLAERRAAQIAELEIEVKRLRRGARA